MYSVTHTVVDIQKDTLLLMNRVTHKVWWYTEGHTLLMLYRRTHTAAGV